MENVIYAEVCVKCKIQIYFCCTWVFQGEDRPPSSVLPTGTVMSRDSHPHLGFQCQVQTAQHPHFMITDWLPLTKPLATCLNLRGVHYYHHTTTANFVSVMSGMQMSHNVE